MKEQFKPLTTSITGIDGAGKSTVSEIVTAQLAPDIRIAKISRPVYAMLNGQRKARYSRLMSTVDRFHSFADERRSKSLSLAANALDVIAQGRLIEPRMITKDAPDIVLGTRDYLIDPAVYATFYSGVLSRRTTEERIALFQKITGSSVRDIIFFLTVPPDEAVSRINRRIDSEAEGSSSSSRLKWRHMHEEAKHLEELQKEYFQALRVMRKIGNPEIHEIDTSQYTRGQVADLITCTLEARLARK